MALTNVDGINGMGVRFRGITFINSSIRFILLMSFHKQGRGDSCNTLAPFSFLLLNFSGIRQDLREHTIYAFILFMAERAQTLAFPPFFLVR